MRIMTQMHMEQAMDIKKGIIVRPYWADLILCGDKTWEIRGSNTQIRGIVKIIKSRTGMIYGEAELYDAFPLTKELFHENYDKHRVDRLSGMLGYETPYAWVFRNAEKYDQPIPYQRKPGQVIWVNF